MKVRYKYINRKNVLEYVEFEFTQHTFYGILHEFYDKKNNRAISILDWQICSMDF